MGRAIDRKKLATLRKQKGMLQPDLAKRVRCSKHTISQIEAGRFLPGESLRSRIAAALGVESLALDPAPPGPLALPVATEQASGQLASDHQFLILGILPHLSNEQREVLVAVAYMLEAGLEIRTPLLKMAAEMYHSRQRAAAKPGSAAKAGG